MSQPLRPQDLHAARWSGVDQAVAWALLCSPLDARALDAEAVGGGSAWTREATIEAYSQVLATLATLDPWRRWLVETYALGCGYRQLACRSSAAGGPGRTSDVLRAHRQARREVAQRLEDVGLLRKSSISLDGKRREG